jgi:hypothetical protein
MPRRAGAALNGKAGRLVENDHILVAVQHHLLQVFGDVRVDRARRRRTVEIA